MLCEKCQKSLALCICAEIRQHATKLHVLILQHPQEPDHEIGTALLAHLALPNSTLKIGLSWRSLSAILDKKNSIQNVGQYSIWVVALRVPQTAKTLTVCFKKGTPIENPKHLDGILVLDGSWSQAKALWWRNAWLLKLHRIILTPQHKSLYKELRKEPRRECLSTIEAIAEVLELLGEKQEIAQHLRSLFSKLLNKKRELC